MLFYCQTAAKCVAIMLLCFILKKYGTAILQWLSLLQRLERSKLDEVTIFFIEIKSQCISFSLQNQRLC